MFKPRISRLQFLDHILKAFNTLFSDSFISYGVQCNKTIYLLQRSLTLLYGKRSSEALIPFSIWILSTSKDFTRRKLHQKHFLHTRDRKKRLRD